MEYCILFINFDYDYYWNDFMNQYHINRVRERLVTHRQGFNMPQGDVVGTAKFSSGTHARTHAHTHIHTHTL